MPTDNDENTLLHERLMAEKPLIEKLWQAMRNELTAAELQDSLATLPIDFFSMEIRKDPFDHTESFYGEWRSDGNLLGSFISHANGMAFAEVDIVKPHPDKEGCFIESTTAWGNLNDINAELRLLPMP